MAIKSYVMIFLILIFVCPLTFAESNNINNVKNIDQAWIEVEKSIHALGDVVKEVTAKDDSVGRFEAYRALLSVIMDNYLNLIYADRNRPEYLPWLGMLTNYGGPSPDFRYGIVQLEPGASYRVWGTRGHAEFVDFQQFVGWHGLKDGFKSSPSQKTFESENIHVDAQGNFGFVLGPESPGHGDWWKLEPGVTTIVIREIFTDLTQKETAVFHLEKIGFNDEGPTVVPAAEAAERLRALARSFKDWAFTFKLGKTFAKVGDNRFEEDPRFNDKSGQNDVRFMLMRFNIPPGQALVGIWKPPAQCRYWDFSLVTDQIQSFNTGYRQISVNKSAANMGSDGLFHFVISHKDPLVANWLDLDGHSVGIVQGRAKQCQGRDIPSVKLVAEGEIPKHLPPDIKMVTAEERAANLALRHAAYQARERR